MEIIHNKNEELRNLKSALIITSLSPCEKYVSLANLNKENLIVLLRIVVKIGLSIDQLLNPDFMEISVKEFFNPKEKPIFQIDAVIKIYSFVDRELKPYISGFVDHRKQEKDEKERKNNVLSLSIAN